VPLVDLKFLTVLPRVLQELQIGGTNNLRSVRNARTPGRALSRRHASTLRQTQGAFRDPWRLAFVL